ncbi:MAG: restriction endonuclease subunit S [Nitrospiraceae bacterium]|nr:MAG: restriction endonuclease subunit S [Nitrospiraceae bacterium]
MKRYAKYRLSGVEWIGEMPVQWEVKRLKFNTYIKARVGWHGLRADEFSLTEGVYCVTGTDLQNGEVSWENCYRVSEERYEEDPYIQLRENDLLITKDGTIGKVAIVRNLNERATLNSGVFVVRPERKEYVTPFMYWALQSPVFSEYVNYTSKGSTINHLYQETFFNLPFILPEIDEQTAIAAYLDEKIVQIDTLTANKQNLIKLLKEERTAIINHAVTKGINPTVKLKPSGIDWLGDIPEHWEVMKLKYLTGILSGFSPEQCQPSESGGTIPYIKVDNLNVEHSGIDKTKEFTTEEFIVSFRPSILFPKRGAAIAINKVALVNEPFSMDTNIMGLELKSDEIDIKFIYYFLKSISLISIADTSTIPQINNKHIEPLAIPFLDICEQKEVVAFIENETQRIDATISKIDKEIELMQEYRTALISEVVTGKIKVI